MFGVFKKPSAPQEKPNRETPTGNFSLLRVPCNSSATDVLFNMPSGAMPYMEKVEKTLEKYKIYIGVKDVKLVVRPYKTRDAFTNLSSSPPTIYLNEHLIDDEEVVEYLIIRELIHIKLHMYPPMRYGGLSYAEKLESNLYFLMPKEKVEEIRERIFKKLIEASRRQ